MTVGRGRRRWGRERGGFEVYQCFKPMSQETE